MTSSTGIGAKYLSGLPPMRRKRVEAATELRRLDGPFPSIRGLASSAVVEGSHRVIENVVADRHSKSLTVVTGGPEVDSGEDPGVLDLLQGRRETVEVS